MSILKKMRDRYGIFGELITFLWEQKLWVLIPMIGFLVLFGLLFFFAGQTGLAPFIYPMF